MPDEYNIEDITSMPSWPLAIPLEPGLDVDTLRSVATDWAMNTRSTQQKIKATDPDMLKSLRQHLSNAVDKRHKGHRRLRIMGRL